MLQMGLSLCSSPATSCFGPLHTYRKSSAEWYCIWGAVLIYKSCLHVNTYLFVILFWIPCVGCPCCSNYQSFFPWTSANHCKKLATYVILSFTCHICHWATAELIIDDWYIERGAEEHFLMDAKHIHFILFSSVIDTFVLCAL